MNSSDLIGTAKRLAGGKGKPKQSDLRRAVSTLYYAMFHELARACADHLAGTNPRERSNAAWRQTYRSLSHGYVISQCRDNRFKNGKFPQCIKDFAIDFEEMQIKRHSADYDPDCKLRRSLVSADIKLVEKSIAAYRTATLKHKKAFSVYVLLRTQSKK